MRQLRAARLTSQLLAGPPARSCVDVVRRLLAVQAQDGRGARLGVRSRSSGLTASDVDKALTNDRTLVVSWLNRRTLHLVTAEDYWWLHRLTTPHLSVGNARRLGQEGVSPEQAERGVAVVVDAVEGSGPQTRAQLRHHLDRAGVPTGGQAVVHVLVAATLRAHLVRGPMVGSEQGFVLAADWLGPQPGPMDREQALATLARRYLEGHGPARPGDLAKWAGITLGDARRGFEAIADEVSLFGPDLWVIAGREEPARVPPPRLLGAFDEILHGWASREPFVGTHRGVVTANGIFRPVALVDGRVVATWGLVAGEVAIHPFEPIARPDLHALAGEAADVSRFLALPHQSV